MRARLGACALLLCTVLAARTRADVVEEPPSCPAGAAPNTSHMGQWCEPDPCATDADCAARGGGRCTEWRLCTRRARIPSGGIPRPDEPRPPDYECEVVFGSCAPDGTCDGTELRNERLYAVTYLDPSPRCAVVRACVRASAEASAPAGSTPPASASPPAPAASAPAGSAATPATTTGWCGVGRARPVRPLALALAAAGVMAVMAARVRWRRPRAA